jgi:hypothetical protein
MGPAYTGEMERRDSSTIKTINENQQDSITRQRRLQIT